MIAYLWTYRGGPFIMYVNIKSLWGTPETNIMLYINYMSQNVMVLLRMAFETLLG